MTWGASPWGARAWGEAPEAGVTLVNAALASNGATATASSTLNAFYPASAAINGDRTGAGWAAGTGGWNDDTPGVWPDYLEVQFSGSYSISKVDVFSLQDAYTTPVEPTPSMLWSLYGIDQFRVEYWTGSAWATIPGTVVTANSLVWRSLTFSPVTTSAVRLVVTASSGSGYSRVVEFEAWGTAAGPAVISGSATSRVGVRSAVTGSKGVAAQTQARAGTRTTVQGAKAVSSATAARAGARTTASGSKAASASTAARVGVRSSALGQAVAVPQGTTAARVGVRSSVSGVKGVAAPLAASAGARVTVSGAKAVSTSTASRVGVRSSALGQSAAIPQGAYVARVGVRSSVTGSKGVAAPLAASLGTRTATQGAKSVSSIYAARAGVRSSALGQNAALPQGVFSTSVGVRCAVSGVRSTSGSASARAGVRELSRGLKASFGTLSARAGVRSQVSGSAGNVPGTPDVFSKDRGTRKVAVRQVQLKGAVREARIGAKHVCPSLQEAD